MMDYKVHTSIHDFSATEWDQMNPSGYPFFRHAFLAALEDSGCIGEQTGWSPNYLVKTHNGRPQSAIPLFIKHHSYAEYVFDWSWAEAYQRHGLDYYPKLLWAAPFTPATGPRLLRLPEQTVNWAAAVELLSELCKSNQLSGWHLNFMTQEDAKRIGEHKQIAIRQACQFHWKNRDYRSFAEYLEYFSSRKRKSVKKERQKVADSGVNIERLTGGQLTAEHIKSFYHCYQTTYLKRGQTGYLNEAFFQQLATQMADSMLLVSAHDEQGPIGYALYFYDQTHLYGRYWGCLQEVDNLHFEACYYQGIEFCIEKGLRYFDPGTQGEHKISRGFEPTLTYSAHWLSHKGFQDAVLNFVEEEKDHILAYQKQAAELLPFKDGAFE